MSEKPPVPPNFALQAAIFEAGLAASAMVIGWAFDQPPSASIQLTFQGPILGVLAVLPLLAMLLACRRSTWRPLRTLSQILDEVVLPLFRNCNWIELAAVSILAGVGEELLFRGLLQTTVAEWSGEFLPHSQSWALVGDWIAVVMVGIIFGLLHALNVAYAVLAALMGVYLGWLFLVTGNLAVPIVAHGLYDFLALTYLQRSSPQREPALGEVTAGSGEQGGGSSEHGAGSTE